MKLLLMFHIKSKAGTHAVSCHKVVLVWETCQQEEGGEKQQKRKLFVLFYLLGKNPDFMAATVKNTINRVIHLKTESVFRHTVHI